LNVRKNSGYSRAISTSVVVIIVIALILVGAVAYYFYASPTTSSTTTSSTTTTPSTSLSYKDTIILGTTDKVQTTIDPADAYDYFGINMINNLGAPLVDFAAGTTNTSPANLQPVCSGL
jgi:peptide/nickel transport system substrate-binding protein